MNYLFYLGIILPTLITICLFFFFIYCWFLQKARKEVLTRRYDPHGKMRRLGMSMEPPPPPDFCRLEATATTPLACHLSPAHYGEDNMAYCVSRSPSTEQQQQQQQQHHYHPNAQQHRRSLYHTYHDSGISAGGLAALSSSDLNCDRILEDPDSRPAGPSGGGGMSYRTCPDSGVSGVSGGFYGAGDNTVLGGAACSQPSCHIHGHHQPQICCEDQYHQQQQQQRHSLYHHQQQQQQQQMRPQHLHHTLVQASVHPSHGVCYGDNTNHPQSPQHYTPPPQHHQQRRDQYDQHNTQDDSRTGRTQQLQMAAHVHYPTSSSSPKESTSSCSIRHRSEADQVFELVSPTATHPKDFHGQDLTTETSFGPQGPMDIMVTPSGDPRLANTSLPAQQSIVLSCLVQQQQQQDQQLSHLDSPAVPHSHHNQQHKPHPHSNAAPTASKHALPSNSSPPRAGHHRDSGIAEDACGSSSSSADQSGGSTNSNNNTINSSTSSERPDSQASHSPSTTDSEDSGFRGSHCPNPALPPPTTSSNRLNKQTNPLLKPMRRPRAKNSRKNASGSSNIPSQAKAPATSSNSSPHRDMRLIANTDSSAPGSPTPLVILDPQNLTPPPDSDSQALGHGVEMIDLAGRGAGTPNRTLDSSPHQSPTSSWPIEPSSGRASDKAATSDRASGGVGGVVLGDISTHLSWNYLQGLSSGQAGSGGVPSPRSAGGAGGLSGAQGGARQLRQDLNHMDVLGYSVV